MASRRAVGSLIGIGFLLMIIAIGVSYMNLRTGVERQSDAILQDMSQFDQESADETLSIQYVELTPGNRVNLIAAVEPGYNIVDVSGVLTGSTFTIRFDDTTEAGDVVQDSWVIDSVYLNLFD